MNARVDPLTNFRFRVEIDGIQHAGFMEVTGIGSGLSVIEYREGTDPKSVRMLGGNADYSNITLKWALTDSMEMFNWYKASLAGEEIRKNVSVTIVDKAGNDRARWEIHDAFPCKYTAPDFNARGNDVAIETLELVHEGVVRVK